MNRAYLVPEVRGLHHPDTRLGGWSPMPQTCWGISCCPVTGVTYTVTPTMISNVAVSQPSKLWKAQVW